LACENAGITVPIAGSGTYVTLNENGTTVAASSYLVDGDEVLLSSTSSFNGSKKVWVHSVGSTFKLMDKAGVDLSDNLNSNEVKVIRSGRRNLQSTSMASVVMMKNPLDIIGTQVQPGFLEAGVWDLQKIVNAGAVEFSEDWDLQCECGIDNVSDVYNPYRMNTKGVWRAKKSHLYLTGRHHNTGNPDPRNDGFYNTFSPFYSFNGGGWQINSDNTDWTYTSEVSAFSPYGFELENEDALLRPSSAQYGYNFMFPMAVSANSKYSQMGYDGFEDYSFDGCKTNEHFGFRGSVNGDEGELINTESHTGIHSLKVKRGSRITRVYHLGCLKRE
jgi:hypothetical protein